MALVNCIGRLSLSGEKTILGARRFSPRLRLLISRQVYCDVL
jgi:hypothetical protein